MSGSAGIPGSAPHDVDTVRSELQRVLESVQFRGSQRRRQLLRYLVERALHGETGHVKEYVLGIDVFEKGDNYDPRIDPAVRVEMARVRAKLAEYYAGEGRTSLLRIEFPKGSYAPSFRGVATPKPVAAPGRWRMAAAIAVAMIALSSVFAWWWLPRGHRTAMTASAEAQAACAKARFFWERRTPEAMRTSVELYQEAIRRAPRYAPAYGGLALAYAVMAADGQLPTEEGAQNAVEAAKEAITLDLNVAEAHAALGLVAFGLRLDWATGEAELRKALHLDPGFATGHQWLGLDLLYVGRLDEAAVEMKEALKLSPKSLAVNTASGLVSYYAGRYDEAIGAAQKTLELDASFRTAHLILGMSYEAQRRWTEAEREYASVRLTSSADSEGAAHLAHLYAVTGRTAAAEKLLGEILSPHELKHVDPYQVAFIYAALDHKADALEWLARSVRERTAVAMKVDRYLDPLREEPEFGRLLAQFNLKNAASF